MTTEQIFYGVCAVASLIMLIYYIKRKHKFTSALFGAITGITALIILNKYGSNIDAEVPLNIFNVCGSVILGVPFVICLVIIKQL